MARRYPFLLETIPNRVLTRTSFSPSPFVLFPVWQDAHSWTSLTTHHFGQHPVLNGLDKILEMFECEGPIAL